MASHSIELSQMTQSYSNLVNTIAAREYHLDWFISKVFRETEVQEFLDVLKYTMIDALNRSYCAVREDIASLQRLLADADGSVDLDYTISLLGCRLAVDASASPPQANSLVLPMRVPRLVSQFQREYRQVLLDHAIKAIALENSGEVRRYVALSDVQSVVLQLKELGSDQEYDSTLEIEGYGGTAIIRLQKKNLILMRYQICRETVKLAVAVAITGGLIVWATRTDSWPLLFYLGIIPLWIVSACWNTLNNLRSEAREYERKRRTRIAAA